MSSRVCNSDILYVKYLLRAREIVVTKSACRIRVRMIEISGEISTLLVVHHANPCGIGRFVVEIKAMIIVIRTIIDSVVRTCRSGGAFVDIAAQADFMWWKSPRIGIPRVVRASDQIGP